MLLDLLSKEEKHAFLDIAVYMISIDGRIQDSESSELKRLNNELGDDAKSYKSGSYKSAIKVLNDSPQAHKRIILLNLIALSMSDDLYHAEEHSLIEQLLESWSISPKKKTELFRLVYQLKDLREKAKLVINA
jgi:tellurite resistance protein